MLRNVVTLLRRFVHAVSGCWWKARYPSQLIRRAASHKPQSKSPSCRLQNKSLDVSPHVLVFLIILKKTALNAEFCTHILSQTKKILYKQQFLKERTNKTHRMTYWIFVFCFTCEIVETDQLLQWPCRPSLHHRDEFTVKPTFKHDLDFIGPIRRATGSRQVTRGGPRYKQRSFIAYNRMFLKKMQSTTSTYIIFMLQEFVFKCKTVCFK